MGATGIHAVKFASGGTTTPAASASPPSVSVETSYTDSEVLAIKYDVWINGIKIGTEKKECIESVEIKETVDGADSCTIKLSDPLFEYLEDNIFIEDNPIKVSMWWEGVSYKVSFEGYISKIGISFENSGIPKLTITCMDKTYLMNKVKKTQTYSNCTSAEVVQLIARLNGYKCVVEQGYAFKKQETITQDYQSDIEFLTKLAGEEVYPFSCRLVDDTIYYVKKGNLTSPAMTLTYKDYPHEVISFSPSINKTSKKETVKKSKVSGSTKALSTSTLSSKSESSSKASDTGQGNNAQSNNYSVTVTYQGSDKWRYNLGR